jgi:hypothetical protein
VFVVVLPLVVLLVLGPADGGELAHPAKSIIAANSPSFIIILSQSAGVTLADSNAKFLLNLVLTF